jgi:DNA-binding beta-propeller fold protein YncE
LSILDANSLATRGVVAVAPDPEQIAILPDSAKAFVTSGTKSEISVVDLKRNRALLANLALDGTPDDDLVLKPDGGELYVPSSDAHGLLIVNTEANEVGDFLLLLGMSPTAATLTEDAQTLYVSDSGAGISCRLPSTSARWRGRFRSANRRGPAS